MAPLWRDQEKARQARELLAPVYGWFIEGFNTLDLREAKALLDELASSAFGFCRVLLPKAALLLYARRRIASFTKTLVFGTIAHHAGMHNLCFILAVLMGR